MVKKLSDKLLQYDSGELAWWCPGCETLHTVEPGKSMKWNGNTELPTFTPSINTNQVCHCFIKRGRILYLGQSQHDLVGLTVDLPDIPAGVALDELKPSL